MNQGFRTGLSRPLILAGRNRSYRMTGPVARDPAIKEQWAAFMEDFGKIEGQMGFEAFGVCHSFDAKAGMMDYMCAVAVADQGQVPHYLFTLTIPARLEAVLVHEGDIADIGKSWERLFTVLLPEGKLQVAQGPQFEVYGDGDAQSIHVPVKSIQS